MDKNKIIQTATRYVQKSQWDKAISEYGKILREDPKDVRILLKVGELQQKKGDTATAAKTLLQVAESYAADGFFLKAVAVYKQVLKLDANLVEVNLQLAELYQQLGLMSDAMGQYQLVAAHHEKAGKLAASIEVIRRIVDLEPDNVPSRIKLAELFARDGRNGEAVQEFRRAAEALKAQQRAEEFLKVGERIVFLDPNDLALTRELAHLYLARGDTKRALAKLQACFKIDPQHVETLELLGRAFRELGQPSKAASVYKELARVHVEAVRPDEAKAAWRRVLEVAPEDEDARAALEEAAARAPTRAAAPVAERPAQTVSLSPASRPVAAPANTREAIARLLTETDVYVKYGLRDKAFEHLRKVLSIEPDCVEAHERASSLFAAGGNQAAAWGELVIVCRICAERGDPDRARDHYRRLLEEAPHLPELQVLADAYVIPSSPDAGQVVTIDAEAPLGLDETVQVDADALRLDPLARRPVRPGAARDDDALAVATATAALEAEVVSEEDLVDASAGLVPTVSSDADDEALAAAMVSAADDRIDEGALVVLPVEEDLAIPVAEPDAWGLGAGDDELLVAGVLPDGEEEVLLAVSADEGLDASDLDALPASADLDGGEAIEPTASTADDGADAGREVGAAELPSAASLPDEPVGFAGLPDEDELLLVRPDDVLELGDDAILEVGEDELIAEDEPIEVEAIALEVPAAPAWEEAAPPPALAGPRDELEAGAIALEEAFASAGPATAAGPELDAELSAELPPLPLDDVLAPPASLDDLVAPLPDPGSLAPPASLDDLLAPGVEPVEGPAAPLPDLDSLAPPASLGELLLAPVEEPDTGVPPPPSSIEAMTIEVETDLETELDEAAFFLSQGLLDEAEEICRSILLRAPGHPGAEARLRAISAARLELPPPPSSVEIARDLAAALEGDLAAGVANLVEDFQYSVDDVFQEFKKGVQQAVRPEDVQTHYDLGIAYKEMGLVPDALEEFGTALAGARGGAREADCLVMIALCRSELGEHREAIARLEEALALPTVAGDHRQAILFEIGARYEALGDVAGALAYYGDVERTDPGFRGVGRIAARLRTRAGGPTERSGSP